MYDCNYLKKKKKRLNALQNTNAQTFIIDCFADEIDKLIIVISSSPNVQYKHSIVYVEIILISDLTRTKLAHI